jgi:hypothetical protein
MLFMVVEKFRDADPKRVGERFLREGRSLPENVTYHASWMDASGAKCFQLMEAADQEALDPWIEHWRDVVEFDVVPVLVSADFWAKFDFK